MSAVVWLLQAVKE